MSSQSLIPQLIRMIVVLLLTLFVVHNSPKFQHLLAQQAMSSGCHQHEDINEANAINPNNAPHQHIHHH